MHEVTEHWQRDLSKEQAEQIAAVANAAFVNSKTTFEQRIQRIVASGEDDTSQPASKWPASKWHVVWNDQTALAAARTFVREMFVAEQPIRILGLASVCTHPSQRGQGLGRMVVESALSSLEDRKCNFSLFQTGVPPFYEKLNCRIIDNPIVSREPEGKPSKNPFHESYVMIYPADGNWPEGTVDLNGGGY